eukprot:TRINITY_DN63848_c0_g1_i1.p1 TRINITY_DN63848_c0_g1~~TRINITY_DN63848_c0_g1_i1.p1  ORF type:complete len:148 (+),score=12.61 TRINITY_DN63848_c0_g1_i1:52-495(+)
MSQAANSTARWYKGLTLNPRNPFDVHVYYTHTPQYKQASMELREKMLARWPGFWYGGPYDDPIGPHPTPMWSLNFKDNSKDPQKDWTEMTEFLQANNPAGLSILVHPNTGDEVADHTTNSVWFGPKVSLFLRPLGGQGRSEGLTELP